MDFDNYKRLEESPPCWNEVIKNYVIELFIRIMKKEYLNTI